jgi:phage terminase small subunit
MALTKKQEHFCQEVVKQDTYSAAYRLAYDCSNWLDKSVNEKASQMMSDVKILTRVNELKDKLVDKVLYTLEASVKRDLKLIERYEKALDTLEDDNSKESDLTAAERTIRYIGVTGYNSAQDRLAKQHGFYEKDNNQSKNKSVVLVERRIISKSDETID